MMELMREDKDGGVARLTDVIVAVSSMPLALILVIDGNDSVVEIRDSDI